MVVIQGQGSWLHFTTSEGLLRPGFSVGDSQIGSFSIISNSAGGEASKEYDEQLELLLERMRDLELTILRIEVDSTRVAHLPVEDRILDLRYPIETSGIADVSALRRVIGAAQRPIGQEPHARGGNSNRRIRIHLRSGNLGPDSFISALGFTPQLDSKTVGADPFDVEMNERELVEEEIEREILDRNVDCPVERVQIVRARIGQGIFRANVLSREPKCRVTGVSDRRFLRASHIKPWRVSTDNERIDGNNGLMLAPHVDLLFDQGFISFTEKGEMLVSSRLAAGLLVNWGIPYPLNVGSFSEEQEHFLAYHRDEVFQN